MRKYNLTEELKAVKGCSQIDIRGKNVLIRVNVLSQECPWHVLRTLRRPSLSEVEEEVGEQWR